MQNKIERIYRGLHQLGERNTLYGTEIAILCREIVRNSSNLTNFDVYVIDFSEKICENYEKGIHSIYELEEKFLFDKIEIEAKKSDCKNKDSKIILLRGSIIFNKNYDPFYVEEFLFGAVDIEVDAEKIVEIFSSFISKIR